MLSFAKSGMCTIENFPPEQGGFSFARDEIRPDQTHSQVCKTQLLGYNNCIGYFFLQCAMRMRWSKRSFCRREEEYPFFSLTSGPMYWAAFVLAYP